MKDNIENLIRNVHAHLSKRLLEDKKLNRESLFEEDLANVMIGAYYNTLSLDEKSIYSKEQLIIELKRLI
jgi:hypothetical protein